MAIRPRFSLIASSRDTADAAPSLSDASVQGCHHNQVVISKSINKVVGLARVSAGSNAHGAVVDRKPTETRGLTAEQSCCYWNLWWSRAVTVSVAITVAATSAVAVAVFGATSRHRLCRHHCRRHLRRRRRRVRGNRPSLSLSPSPSPPPPPSPSPCLCRHHRRRHLRRRRHRVRGMCDGYRPSLPSPSSCPSLPSNRSP